MAVSKQQSFNDEAQEDFRFYSGDQWDEADKRTLNEKQRPVLTVNVTRPLINLVCGYQANNRFEPDFLPKRAGGEEICQITKGINKYVMDETSWEAVCDDVFRDKIICGKGYYWVEWEWDYSALDGQVKISRQSPFDIYVDPECIKDDLSDARYIIKATWEDKDKVAQVYPEFKDEIEEMSRQYDTSERMPQMTDNGEPLWYSSDYKKIRVVQLWYRDETFETKYIMPDGTTIDEEQAKTMPDLAKNYKFLNIRKLRAPVSKIKFCVFCEDVIFEDEDSPYKHGYFPLVQEFCYHTNEMDVPQGIVRDLKDPQREINKLRSQRMHIINTMANRIWLSPKGALDESDKRNLRDNGSTPGALVEYNAVGNPPTPVDTTGVPAGFVQLEEITRGDIRNISGINEELLGSDLTANASGRAIELRQKQAMTQIAILFENQKKAMKQILKLLWGDQNRPGLIPQYFSEEKCIRIIGPDGKNKYVNVAPTGQPMVQQPVMNEYGQPATDPQGQLIVKTVYDLSKFEFDIAINETPETATTRLSNFYALVEAQKSGIQIPPDIILDFMDFPGKEEVMQRVKQQQDMANQLPPPKATLTINFKDLPIEAQAAILNAEGIQVNPKSIAAQQAANNPPPTQPIQPQTMNRQQVISNLGGQ